LLTDVHDISLLIKHVAQVSTLATS